MYPTHFASVTDMCPYSSSQWAKEEEYPPSVCESERGRAMARGRDMQVGGGGTKGGSSAPVFKRDRPSEEAGSVCVFVWRGTEEGCRWHGAGAGLAHCPLAVPDSICHQQEHLQPKVPLSPSVRVTSLAFPLVQGPRPPGRR